MKKYTSKPIDVRAFQWLGQKIYLDKAIVKHDGMQYYVTNSRGQKEYIMLYDYAIQEPDGINYKTVAKDYFEAIAANRGLSLNQFAKMCVTTVKAKGLQQNVSHATIKETSTDNPEEWIKFSDKYPAADKQFRIKLPNGAITGPRFGIEGLI